MWLVFVWIVFCWWVWVVGIVWVCFFGWLFSCCWWLVFILMIWVVFLGWVWMGSDSWIVCVMCGLDWFWVCWEMLVNVMWGWLFGWWLCGIWEIVCMLVIEDFCLLVCFFEWWFELFMVMIVMLFWWVWWCGLCLLLL